MILKLKWRIILWGGLTVLFKFLDFYGNDWIWIGFLVIAIIKISAGFFSWYVRGILMTSEGLVFIYWPRFFHRKTERIDWHTLDEIEVERIGIKSFALSYGTLRFQKVNGGEQIEEKCIARPHRTARRVEHFKELMLDEKNFMEESALKDLLGKVAVKHVEAHGQPNRPEEAHFNTMKKRLENSKTQKETSREVVKESTINPLVPVTKVVKEVTGFSGESDDEEIIYHAKRSRRITGGDPRDIEKELDDTGGIDLDL